MFSRLFLPDTATRALFLLAMICVPLHAETPGPSADSPEPVVLGSMINPMPLAVAVSLLGFGAYFRRR